MENNSVFTQMMKANAEQNLTKTVQKYFGEYQKWDPEGLEKSEKKVKERKVARAAKLKKLQAKHHAKPKQAPNPHPRQKPHTHHKKSRKTSKTQNVDLSSSRNTTRRRQAQIQQEKRLKKVSREIETGRFQKFSKFREGFPVQKYQDFDF